MNPSDLAGVIRQVESTIRSVNEFGYAYVLFDNNNFFLVNYLDPVDPNDELPYEIMFFFRAKPVRKLTHNKTDDVLHKFLEQCCFCFQPLTV